MLRTALKAEAPLTQAASSSSRLICSSWLRMSCTPRVIEARPTASTRLRVEPYSQSMPLLRISQRIARELSTPGILNGIQAANSSSARPRKRERTML
ncbi:hypothetical protein D3C79_885050 [compost metagenome]